jgi:ornithine cyclodeaminase
MPAEALELDTVSKTRDVSIVRVLSEAQARSLIQPREALVETRAAFKKMARGEALIPPVMSFDIPENRGDSHAKGAYLRGAPYFSVKIASGFYQNPDKGLPVVSGIVLVFDATTGRPATIILDNGYLTDLRTGAAGAVAADLLAPRTVVQVGVLGCGSQARYQLEALLGVRDPARVIVFCRTRVNAEAYAAEMLELHGVHVVVADKPRQVVEGSQIVVTTTPSREPVVLDAWVSAGTHITAVGSDLADKQELDPCILGRAKVVADLLSQCLQQGELHHAVAAEVLKPERVYAELGEIAAGLKEGRTSEDEVTVADLTGVGALDAAMANYVAARAFARKLGTELPL